MTLVAFLWKFIIFIFSFYYQMALEGVLFKKKKKKVEHIAASHRAVTRLMSPLATVLSLEI